MKIDKLFTVLVIGGGLMTGCGGAQTKVDPAPPAAEEAPADEAEAPASAPAAEEEEGKAGKCAWF